MGKGGRSVGLTALPRLCVDCLEILVVSICSRKDVSRCSFYSYSLVHLKVFLNIFKKMYKISVSYFVQTEKYSYKSRIYSHFHSTSR